MNLSAYDIIKSKMDIKNWIDVRKRCLCSVVIPFHTYYYLAKRYSPFYKKYTYYIILTNEVFDDPVPRAVDCRRKGLIKINLRDIWDKSSLSSYKTDFEINVKVVDKQDDCIIYELDI